MSNLAMAIVILLIPLNAIDGLSENDFICAAKIAALIE